HERKAFDAVVIDWADRLDGASLAGELAYYSGAIKSHLRKPKWVLVTHMFNHQTHHRGQVHCMLTQAGGKPRDTDLPVMPMCRSRRTYMQDLKAETNGLRRREKGAQSLLRSSPRRRAGAVEDIDDRPASARDRTSS